MAILLQGHNLFSVCLLLSVSTSFLTALLLHEDVPLTLIRIINGDVYRTRCGLFTLPLLLWRPQSLFWCLN